MKKTVALLIVIIALLLTSACTTTPKRNSSLMTDLNAPKVSTKSSCWKGEARGKYTVSTKEYGTLCSGNAYAKKEKAIANPLEIYNAGNEITVTLADDSVKTVKMTAGDQQLISCDSGYFNGYLYVIVKSFSEAKDNSEAPYVEKKSSCSWISGEIRGKYLVSTKEYGVLCTGNGYVKKEKAIAKPLQIQSNGHDVVVTLAADDFKTVTLASGETQLISCNSGSFNSYLYVVVVWTQ